MIRVGALVSPPFRRQLHEMDPYAILIEPIGALGYRQRPHSTYRYGNGTVATSNAMGFRGPEVSVRKPGDTFRIVLLGGSTSHGFGVNDTATIDAFMRRELAERYPDRKFEVVNLAFDGYDSYQDLTRFREDGLRLDPDVVIVNSGINDVRNARYERLQEADPRTLIWEADLRRLRLERRVGRSWRTRAKHYLYLARLLPLVRDIRHRSSETRTMDHVAPNPQAADYFERNVSGIDSLAAAHGVAVLLSTPPSSLAMKYPANATSSISYWINDAATTQQYRDELDRRLRRLATRPTTSGSPVVYVQHHLTKDMFIDDCHLNAEGNRQMASDFVAALQPLLEARRKAVARDSRVRT